MKILTLVFLTTVLCVSPCLSQPKTQTDDVTTSHYSGKWAGKWDDSWKVEFTVTPVDAQKARVLYEWEEVTSAPMRKTSLFGQVQDGKLNVGRVIKLELLKGEKDKASARGEFQNPRTATLTRVSSETEKINSK